MKKDVQQISLAILIAVIGMAMAACQQGTPEATDTGDGSGGTETMAPISKDVTLDPNQVQDADSKIVADYIFEPLVAIDQGTTSIWLARSWTIAEDQLAYTFELRTDVSFSDGSPMNADEVVATFTRWFDTSDAGHGTGSYKGWLDVFGGFKGETDAEGKKKSSFDGAEKTGDYTVVLHLNRPVDGLLEKLATPTFYISKLTADGNLIGTGPYMVGQKTDKNLLLIANPNYVGPFPPAGDLDFPFK